MKRSDKHRRSIPRADRRLGPISHPPQLYGIELRHSVTLRYRATAAFTTNVSFQNLLDTLLVAISAIAGVDLFQTVKVRRVRVWGIAAIGTASSVSVEFGGTVAGIVGDQAIHTDTSMGIQPAYIDARPNVRALVSDYQINSAANAFTISGPAGSVVDLDLSFRSQYAPNVNTAAQNALVGATAGIQYIRGFDGFAVAATNFVPEYTVGQI
jgi:hypothetical protein